MATEDRGLESCCPNPLRSFPPGLPAPSVRPAAWVPPAPSAVAFQLGRVQTDLTFCTKGVVFCLLLLSFFLIIKHNKKAQIFFFLKTQIYSLFSCLLKWRCQSMYVFLITPIPNKRINISYFCESVPPGKWVNSGDQSKKQDCLISTGSGLKK